METACAHFSIYMRAHCLFINMHLSVSLPISVCMQFRLNLPIDGCACVWSMCCVPYIRTPWIWSSLRSYTDRTECAQLIFTVFFPFFSFPLFHPLLSCLYCTSTIFLNINCCICLNRIKCTIFFLLFLLVYSFIRLTFVFHFVKCTHVFCVC